MVRKKNILWIITMFLIIVFGTGCAANEANTNQQQAMNEAQEPNEAQETPNEVQETSNDTQESPFVALEELFHLDEVVKIYVPSIMNIDEPIDNTPYVNKTLEELSALFGGATAIEGSGAWLSDENQLILEDVTIVYAFAEELNDENINQVIDIAKSLKEEMGQSSVSIEVNGKMYFVE